MWWSILPKSLLDFRLEVVWSVCMVWWWYSYSIILGEILSFLLFLSLSRFTLECYSPRALLFSLTSSWLFGNNVRDEKRVWMAECWPVNRIDHEPNRLIKKKCIKYAPCVGVLRNNGMRKTRWSAKKSWDRTVAVIFCAIRAWQQGWTWATLVIGGSFYLSAAMNLMGRRNSDGSTNELYKSFMNCPFSSCLTRRFLLLGIFSVFYFVFPTIPPPLYTGEMSGWLPFTV